MAGGVVPKGLDDGGIVFQGADVGGVPLMGGDVAYGSNAGVPKVAPVPVEGRAGTVELGAVVENGVVPGRGVVAPPAEGTGTSPPLVGGGGAPGNCTRCA